MQITNYLIGSDIEVFVAKGDEIVSAEGLIKGTKEKPHKTGRKGCATSLDNISAEFTVNPTRDYQEMWEDIVFNLNYLENSLPDGYSIAIQASAHLKSGLDTPNARLIGCEPDWCVYTQEVNVKPDISEMDLRVCGGHIHIGAKELQGNLSLCEAVIKALDVYVGLPSVLLDDDRERRELYGKAGALRFPKHGVEYRTPSNFWIKSKEMVEWMFQNVDMAIQSVNNGVSFQELESEIVSTIDTCDVEKAETLCKQLNIPLHVSKQQLVA